MVKLEFRSFNDDIGKRLVPVEERGAEGALPSQVSTRVKFRVDSDMGLTIIDLESLSEMEPLVDEEDLFFA